MIKVYSLKGLCTSFKFELLIANFDIEEETIQELDDGTREYYIEADEDIHSAIEEVLDDWDDPGYLGATISV